MDDVISKDELIDLLNSCDVVNCTMHDDTSFSIGIADYWIGGNDGYICELLGNVEYGSIKACVNALYDYMDRHDYYIKDID